ncbi:MAG: hypothetical protein OHK0039_21630 [Bacteroidia bacterium]
MDILERIIENLTSDEVRRFKILSNRFKAEEEKKLLLLFNAMRAGDFKEKEESVIRQFYGESGPKARNSYYRLRNKLLNNLEKSLLFYHFNYKNAIESFSNIQLSILYRERGLYREAYYQLKKAEKVATEYDQFHVLEVIYDEMVKLATYQDVEVEEVIARRRENLKKIDILRNTSEVLALITHQLSRRNYARSKRSQSVIETLEQIREGLEEQQDIFHSTSGKIMIMKSVASILIQKSAYEELADYARAMLDDFTENKLFSKDNHAIRLMLRIWRINSLQKVLRLDEAWQEIGLLWDDLQLFKRLHFHEFVFNYYSARIYNLKLSGQLDEAGRSLDEALQVKDVLTNEVHEHYLLISLADQRFSEARYTEALDVIKRIKAHPVFERRDEELRCFVHVFELVALFEAGQHTRFNTAFRYLRRQFKTLLKDEFYARARKFLDLLQRLNQAAIEGKKVFLKAAYRHFVRTYPPTEIGDNHIILYEVYLRARLEEETSYYKLLLEEIAQRKTQA